MNDENVSQARQDIEEALSILNRQPYATEMMQRIAASVIVAALLPQQQKTAGSEYYRIKAEDWLTLLLSEPGLTIGILSERVCALVDVSETIKCEIGSIASRLTFVSVAAKQE